MREAREWKLAEQMPVAKGQPTPIFCYVEKVIKFTKKPKALLGLGRA